MSYDIRFKVKVEGIDKYVEVGDCTANITWNVREIITQSTGLPWINEANNGLCVDVIPKIMKGFNELFTQSGKYKKYESPNGYGTVKGTMYFFGNIIRDWNNLCVMLDDSDVINAVTFWIE